MVILTAGLARSQERDGDDLFIKKFLKLGDLLLNTDFVDQLRDEINTGSEEDIRNSIKRVIDDYVDEPTPTISELNNDFKLNPDVILAKSVCQDFGLAIGHSFGSPMVSLIDPERFSQALSQIQPKDLDQDTMKKLLGNILNGLEDFYFSDEDEYSNNQKPTGFDESLVHLAQCRDGIQQHYNRLGLSDLIQKSYLSLPARAQRGGYTKEFFAVVNNINRVFHKRENFDDFDDLLLNIDTVLEDKSQNNHVIAHCANVISRIEKEMYAVDGKIDLFIIKLAGVYLHLLSTQFEKYGISKKDAIKIIKKLESASKKEEWLVNDLLNRIHKSSAKTTSVGIIQTGAKKNILDDLSSFSDN